MNARWVSALALAVVGLSCDDPTGPKDFLSPTPDVRAFVTGSALENIDADGHFRLPAPTWPGGPPIISPQEAGEFALGFIRTIIVDGIDLDIPDGVPAREVMEAWHGKPIRWTEVTLGPRTAFFSESHLEPVPDTLPNFLKNHLGPYYHVPLFVKGMQVVTISIAAYATGLSMDSSGHVRLPSNELNGGEFRWGGVPYSWPYGDPPSPEHVVKRVATATGAKVTEVPYLLTPRREFSRSFSPWVIHLDREVLFKRRVDGATGSSSTVYVSPHPLSLSAVDGGSFEELYLLIPNPDQPEEEVFPIPGGAFYRAPVRAGKAVDLQLVSPVG